MHKIKHSFLAIILGFVLSQAVGWASVYAETYFFDTSGNFDSGWYSDSDLLNHFDSSSDTLLNGSYTFTNGSIYTNDIPLSASPLYVYLLQGDLNNFDSTSFMLYGNFPAPLSSAHEVFPDNGGSIDELRLIKYSFDRNTSLPYDILQAVGSYNHYTYAILFTDQDIDITGWGSSYSFLQAKQELFDVWLQDQASGGYSYQAEVFPAFPSGLTNVSTTFQFSGLYNNPEFVYDNIEILLYTSPDDIIIDSYIIDIASSSYMKDFDLPYSVATSLPSGEYAYTVRLHDIDTGTYTDYTDEIIFNVASGTVPINQDFNNLNCENVFTDFFCYVKKGVFWLFLPDTAYLGDLIENQLLTKFPFSWFYEIYELFASQSYTADNDWNLSLTLFGGSSYEGDLVLFGTDYFSNYTDLTNTVRSILQALIWFGFAFTSIRIIKKI